jgi:hypothetical protein
MACASAARCSGNSGEVRAVFNRVLGSLPKSPFVRYSTNTN